MENKQESRKLGSGVVAHDDALGPLKLLPGKWRNLFPMKGNAPLPGHGWNMIALPFPEGEFGYRLLLNQYNEELDFKLVDKGVANRGLKKDKDGKGIDQFVAALDYEQTIVQVAAGEFVDEQAGFPKSGKEGGPGLAIHHEPGLFLYMPTETINGMNIARTASIPHGDSVMAFGESSILTDSRPDIKPINGLPIPKNGNGLPTGIDQDYVTPYKHFHDNFFRGKFDPTRPNDLLKDGIPTEVEISEIIKLDFNTTTSVQMDEKVVQGGVINIPFVVKNADATEMHSIFWIVSGKDTKTGKDRLFLQYSQTVMLDFLGDIWPHVSINTLEKVL